MDFERSIVDKFWTDVPGITQEIRKAGVEQQATSSTSTPAPPRGTCSSS